MAAPVTHFVSMKVIEGYVSMLRQWTVVAVMWIETIVHVAIEVVWAMVPGAGSDKDTAVEPFRPIVAVRGATVWGIVEVAVRTNRRYADINCDPRRCRAWHTQRSSGEDSKHNEFKLTHQFLLSLGGEVAFAMPKLFKSEWDGHMAGFTSIRPEV
jgi:hypothetical protein